MSHGSGQVVLYFSRSYPSVRFIPAHAYAEALTAGISFGSIALLPDFLLNMEAEFAVAKPFPQLVDSVQCGVGNTVNCSDINATSVVFQPVPFLLPMGYLDQDFPGFLIRLTPFVGVSLCCGSQ